MVHHLDLCFGRAMVVGRRVVLVESRDLILPVDHWVVVVSHHPKSSVKLTPVGLDKGGTLSLPSPAPHRTVEGTPGPVGYVGLQRERRVRDRACIDRDERRRPPLSRSSQALSSHGVSALPHRSFPMRLMSTITRITPASPATKETIFVLHDDAYAGCSNKNFLPAWCCVSAIHIATPSNSKPSSCVLARF